MRAARVRRCITVMVATAAAFGAFVACVGPDESTGTPFDPATDGTLTVATSTLGAPGLWMTSDGGYDGFEAGLAEAIADHLGLDRVEVVEVHYDDLLAGRLGGADVAMSAITPTEERDQALDFTTPYLEAPPGVLVRSGVDAHDAKSLRGLRWVVVTGSTLTGRVEDDVRPTREPLTEPDRAAGVEALADDRADALLLDLPVALGIRAHADGELDVSGRLSGGEGLAVALPDGSPNRDAVDSAVRALVADGTVADLEERWIGASRDVPYLRVS